MVLVTPFLLRWGLWIGRWWVDFVFVCVHLTPFLQHGFCTSCVVDISNMYIYNMHFRSVVIVLTFYHFLHEIHPTTFHLHLKKSISFLPLNDFFFFFMSLWLVVIGFLTNQGVPMWKMGWWIMSDIIPPHLFSPWFVTISVLFPLGEPSPCLGATHFMAVSFCSPAVIRFAVIQVAMQGICCLNVCILYLQLSFYPANLLFSPRQFAVYSPAWSPGDF